ncbi:hypothetical protein FGB62_93g032 [Gracilaria domingensis]|nr:hypothetical protein FGB62_93g032 [Gracilaria domingensis]
MGITYVRLLEVCAAIGTGFAAGGMSYITLVEAPSRSKLSPADQLQHWRTTFPSAMALFKPTNIMLVPTLIACSRLTGKSLYLGAALPFALIAPFTAVAMMPTNKKLLTCPSPVEDKEEDEVKDMIKSWARKHAVRVFLGVSGFVCTVSACALLPEKS